MQQQMWVFMKVKLLKVNQQMCVCVPLPPLGGPPLSSLPPSPNLLSVALSDLWPQHQLILLNICHTLSAQSREIVNFLLKD